MSQSTNNVLFPINAGDAYEVFRRVAWTYGHQRLPISDLLTCWRPFDGPPCPDRKFWSARRIERAIEQLLAEGSIVIVTTHTGPAYEATAAGLQQYRRAA